MNEEELKGAIDALMLSYDTQAHPDWSLRDYLLDFAVSLLAAQRERDAMVASARAFKWREILDRHPDDAMANQRWHEACDIGTLIRQY